MSNPSPPNSRRLRNVLVLVFLLALFLGPGLGAHLAGGDPGNARFLFGIPALYLWLVTCWLLMAGCIVIAARTFWKETD